MKREMVFNALRRNIITGITPPGARLPTELELAARYGVARDTLRDSLKKLEEEGLIERIKSRGTFVRQPEKDSGERVLSFLIPYPEYLQNRQVTSFRPFSDLFYGAVRAASEEGWRVQTIPFSKNNDNRNIDWEALSCLRRDSRLIVFGQWYHTAFKVFLEREIRVGFIRMFGPRLTSPWEDTLSRWINGIFDIRGAFEALLCHFHKCGCRRLLYTGSYTDDPLNEMAIACRETGGKLGMEVHKMELSVLPRSSHDFFKTMREAWEARRPDAITGDPGIRLLLRENFNIYRETGIPESVKIVFFRDNPAYLKARPQISALSLDHDLMGFRTAKALMEKIYSPRQLFQKLDFMDRESSGGPHASSAKMEMEMCHEPFSYHI